MDKILVFVFSLISLAYIALSMVNGLDDMFMIKGLLFWIVSRVIAIEAKIDEK